mmetsp:Transcript_15540/g.31438  ORF Transcript_15540/g.31438 Transcript_15540/m.31438 type:complete len:768 (-) Transcript_15540:73-2376(-)
MSEVTESSCESSSGTSRVVEPGESNVMMQIIDYTEHFSSDLQGFMEGSGLAGAGFDYNVVAIIGPQSSGKSTLMNLLFQTSFRTMDEASGRYQVTEGVWLGRDPVRPIVVLDLEGTDSRERGEDAITFERKSALFALALAEVLVVNIWTQDVGRFNASNLSLLKTVLELDLQLFVKDQTEFRKTRLLFVLRDHVSTPMEKLKDILTADVEKIWDTITKPTQVELSSVTQFFDLDFVSLPHKVLRPEDFEREAMILRERFRDGRVFHEGYKRGILADGFATFASNIWEIIRTNQDLDLPSQRSIVAIVRCDAISRECTSDASSRIEEIRSRISNEITHVEDLSTLLSGILSEGTERFTERSSKYDQDVVQGKRQDLLEHLRSLCKEVYVQAEEKAEEVAFRTVQDWIRDRLSTPLTWVNFQNDVGIMISESLQKFDSICGPVHAVETFSSRGREKLMKRMSVEVENARIEIYRQSLDDRMETFSLRCRKELGPFFDVLAEDMWQMISSKIVELSKPLKNELDDVMKELGFGLDTEERKLKDVESRLFRVVQEVVKTLIGDASGFTYRLTKFFDQSFRFDDRGVPRSWGPSDDVDAIYLAALESSKKYLKQFAFIEIGEISKPNFTEEDQHRLQAALSTHASAACLDAKRTRDNLSIRAKIPIWLIGLLIVLGWNEIVAVLRNPYLLVALVLLLPVAYLTYSLDLLTPLRPFMASALERARTRGVDLLSQAFESTGSQESGGAATMSSAPSHSSSQDSHVSSNVNKKGE